MARLIRIRERDAALEALRDVADIYFEDSRPLGNVARAMLERARQTITGIETGAIHENR